MQIKTLVQNGKPRVAENVAGLIAQAVMREPFDSVGVAVAYASVAGLHTLLKVLKDAESIRSSYWLFGLDDCLTHPSVLDRVIALPNATLRVAGERIDGRRFHPKVYWFSSQKKKTPSALIAGSSNLTINGLSDNVESVVSLSAGNRKDALHLESTWNQLWAIGKTPSHQLLAQYKADFELRPKHGEDIKKGVEILTSDSASVDPSCASICWIEVGNITGFQGEQLEIKAEQALFFGLAIQGGADTQITVSLDSGAVIKIPVKYRGNAMWRFNLPQAIPEVSRGLRPGGGRSPYVAIFERLNGGALRLSFVISKSASFKKIRSQSQRAGTVGRTTAREYGWF